MLAASSGAIPGLNLRSKIVASFQETGCIDT